ncbi:caspase family protein [Scytonema sp. PCC 10023]|uniref:nSTAND1 domain-containing NTPase n=1 Tax=Scytonema sp. PCC 10023 TaxID=1680591 RepID=UPI0039C731F9
MPEFKRSLAVVIGINQYVNGIPELKTAVNDANQLALILEENYQYQVLRLLDREATQDKLTSLLAAFEEQTLPFPDGSKIHLEPDDQLLFYFAGHGFGQEDGLDNASGPAGFLVPQDGQRDDCTWLPMQQLHDALVKLPCRHLLIILDCCFAGTFRWAGRDREMMRSQKIYRERYDRYIAGCAQQVITSAAHDEKAADSLYPFGQRGDHEGHSPFAEALFLALSGEADFTNDGVMTATELYLYLHDKITTKQTPEICQLKRHDKGEYIFPVRGFDRERLEEAPKLDEKTNPYKGLASFEEEDSDKFFGRTALTQKLQEFVTTHALTVVLGASGTGKSSLVKAGLIPQLKKQQEWRILAPIRLGESPFRALNNTLIKENLPVVDQKAPEPGVKTLLARLANWSQLNPNSKLLLVIDQCEELITLCRNNTEQEKFLLGLAEAIMACPEQLRLVLTLRNDFEPQLSDTALKPYWTSARFVVPGMTREQLREAIVEPASARVMYFEPPTLVDELIDEVMQMPGALPLLSFTLSELYFKYIDSVRQGTRSDRAITQEDYEELGGVTHSLTQRADFEYEQLKKRDEAYTLAIKQVMLRMVAVDGGELARRKVLLSELEYPPTQNERVQEVIQQFTDARLLVKGQDSEGNLYVEPAHDALVRGWQKLLLWKQQEQESLILQRRLTPAAMEWNSKQLTAFHWSADPRDWWKQFWDRQQHIKFLWHTNPRLDFLKQVLNSTDNWFNQVEAEFVRRSIKRQLNNRRRTIGLVVTGFAVVLGFAGFQWYQTQQAQIKTLIESSNARFASGQQLDALIDGLKAGKKLQTLKLLGLADADTQRQVVRSMSSAFYGVKEFNRLEGHRGGVHCLSFSPDGQTIATASADNTVKLWKRDGTFLKTLTAHSAAVRSVSFSPDDKMIATASADQTVRLWKRDGTFLKTLTGHEAVVTSVSFSPDGQTLASASWDSSVILWDRNGNFIRRLPGHNQPVDEVSFSPDNQMIASASWDTTVRLWKRDGTPLKTLKHNVPVRTIKFSPDSQAIAAAGDDATVKLWRRDGRLISPLIVNGHSKPIYSLSFSPDGQTIATASEDKTVKLWKRDGTLLHTLTGHSAGVDSVSFSPDGQFLASASWDSTVRFWKPDSTSLNRRIWSNAGILGITFSPDNQMIATASWDKTVKLWKRDGTLLHTLNGHSAGVDSVSFSPDSQLIASASEDTTVKLWKRDGTLLHTLNGHSRPIYGVSFSPDSQLIASASDDKTVRLWKRDGTFLKPLTEHSAAANSVSFSLDGQMIASSSNDNTIKLWKRDGTLLLAGHSNTVRGISFSPNSQTLASASWDGTVKLWKRDGALLRNLTGHSDQVWDVSFSPDGKTIASASSDKTVKLWSKDGILLSTLTGHNQVINSVSFSPDGKTLASGSADKTIILWNLELLELDTVMKHGCNWVRGYLKTNPKADEDRHCDDIRTSRSHNTDSKSTATLMLNFQSLQH